MNNKINVYSQKNIPSISFGRLMPDVKQMIRTPEVAVALEKYCISKCDIDILERSSLKIALLSSLMDSKVPNTSGLVLSATKRTKLPNVYITSSGDNIQNSDVNAFAFCVKKAVEMVDIYNGVKSKINTHLDRKKQTLAIRKLEQIANEKLRTFKEIQHIEDEATLSQLDQIGNQLTILNRKLKAEKTKTQEDLCERVSTAWKVINARKFDKSA